MREDPDSVILTRRSVLALAGIGFASSTRLSAAVVDFWNKKAPDEWSTEEIDKLLTKSPWAKEVSAPYAAGAGDARGMPGSGRNGGGGLGIPGIGNIGILHFLNTLRRDIEEAVEVG